MSDSLYRELILEEYKHPKNKGTLEKPTCTCKKSNPVCGDEMTITLIVNDGIVTDIKFSCVGCAISQAAASLFTEHIKGKKVEEIENMDEKTILELLGIELNPMRMKCAVLVLRAVAGALEVK
ncbi:SUF system NifU family Fe-S cluster assembly protein [Candidatus Woesearchaeota archaeon]|nr:SUF system NifU family Fe-S cluster assembly protein [Candidatus Woesearchaeota archaeon]